MGGMYNAGQASIGRGRVTSTGAYAVMLVSTGYTFNHDHNVVDDGSTSDPLSYEISGAANYARQTLASVTLTQDDATDCAYLDATDPVFTALGGGFTIGSVVIFPYSTSSTQLSTGTTGDTGQVLLACYDTTGIATNGSNVTFTLSTAGFLRFGTTT
jgi:hypothetical protein